MNYAVLLINLFLPLTLLAQEPQGTFKILSASAAPGGEALVPFVINGNFPIQGFSFSIDFDEELLEVIGIEQAFARPDGEEWWLYKFAFDNNNNVPGNAGTDEGNIAVAGIFSLKSFDDISQIPPANMDHEILRFRIRVKPDAPLGTTTEIRFLEGAHTHPASPPVAIVCTLQGQSADVEFQINPFQIPGRFKIGIDVTAFNHFIRGDYDGNKAVEITDAQLTLEHLFLGGPPPGCMDAADSNDDGDVDISDPITTLRFLFLGNAIIPPPSAIDPSADPTGDTLKCLDSPFSQDG